MRTTRFFVGRAARAAVAGALLCAAAFGCGSDMRFAAPPQALLQGGVSLNFQRAEADDETIDVHFYVRNVSDQLMLVNRDGFGLRLPTGEILAREGTNQVPYEIPPGAGHNVWVKFSSPHFNLAKMPSASVIVGGISYANDPVPRVVGEVPLSAVGPVD